MAYSDLSFSALDSSWSSPLVVSTVTGTHTNAGSITTADTIYIDWCVGNSYVCNISTVFYTSLYVDNVLRSRWYTSSLSAGCKAYVTDYNLGSLSAGTHTIQLVTDSTGTVTESNEYNNTYTKTITVNSIVSTDPDDTFSKAKSVDNGTYNDSISTTTDVDMYKITVNAGDTVCFTTNSRNSTTVDTYIRLFNSSGTQLAYNDDGGSGFYSSLSYYFQNAGTYYLGVSSFWNRAYNPASGAGDTSGTTGDYALTITGITPLADTDDTISEARSIGNGTVNDGITTTTDVDVYKFNVYAGNTITLRTAARDSSTVDTYLRLFNSSGTQLACDDDSAGSLYSRITYTASADTVLYLGVSSFLNRTYNVNTGSGDIAGTTGNYSLTVSGITLPSDTDNTLAKARLAGSGTYNDSISISTDIDMYKFTAAAGQTFTFTTAARGSSTVDTYLRLFNSSGTQLACNDDISIYNRYSSLSYTFSTAGTYYLGVSSFGNRAYNPLYGTGTQSGGTGNYALTITSDIVDSDDTIAEARSISLNTSVTDSISTVTDVDMYKFTVSAGQTVTFTTSARNSNAVDTYLRLFNSSGTQLTYNDDISTSNRYSSFSYTFASAGTYYIGVSSFGNRAYTPTNGSSDSNGTTGDYTLSITGSSDTDDTIAEAAAKSSLGNGTVNDSISTSTDVDIYKVTVYAGNTVTFRTSSRDSSTVDTYLRLFNSSGTQLASNDDISGSNRYSSLSYTFSSAGTYYIGVSSYGNRAYSPTNGESDRVGTIGNYALTVSGIIQPETDSDDTIAEAASKTALTSGTVNDSISNSTDVDLFRIVVGAGERVTFRTSSRNSNTVDTYLRLFNSSGTQLAYNDDISGYNRYSSLTYTFATAGTYYIGVSSYGNRAYSPTNGNSDQQGGSGDYALTVTRQSLDDNTIATAHAVSVGSSVSDSISPANDVDMYKFTVSAGQKVCFDIDRASGTNLDSYIRLFNSSGTQLARSDDAAAPGESSTRDSYLEYTFAAAGTYYLGVSAFGNSSYSALYGTGTYSAYTTGGYTLNITAGNAEDTDDQIAEARTLTLGTAISDSIDPGTDVDMYKITVSAGQQINFSVTLNGLSDSYLRLFNSSGSLLAYNDDASSTNRGSSLSYRFNTAGTYYVGVSAYGNSSYNAVTGAGDADTNRSGRYIIQAVSAVTDDSYEDNDTKATAASLGTFSTSGGKFENLIMADSADWYKFTVSSDTGATGALNVNFTNASGNIDIELYNSSNQRIGYSYTSQNTESVSLANLSAGDYYLKVTPHNNTSINNSYNITYTLSEKPVPVTGTNYVVLFAGCYNQNNNLSSYYANIKDMYNTLIDIGIEADHIYLLFADGTDTAKDQCVKDSNGNITGYINSDLSFASSSHVYSATVSNLQSVMTTMSRTVTNQDNFLFYSYDHGSATSSYQTLCCWQGSMKDTTFASYANNINAKYSTYIMAQCFSGGMIEDITLKNNMFLCSAASRNQSSYTLSYISTATGEIVGYNGFAQQIAAGLQSGINNTTELYNYATSHYSHSNETPQKYGSSFSIFQNISNSVGNASSEADFENITVNGTTDENQPPVISALHIVSEDEEVVKAHINDIVTLSVDVEDPEDDAVTKVSFYLINSEEKSVLLGMLDEETDDYLWCISEDLTPGDYRIAAVAEDSNTNSSAMFTKNFRVQAENTDPSITNLAFSSNTASAGSQITISGNCQDAEGDDIPLVLVYLDSNHDTILEYPDERIGSAEPDADGHWECTVTLDADLAAGEYSISATACDESLMNTKFSNKTITLTSVVRRAKSDVDGNGVSDVMFQFTGGNYQIGYWMNGTSTWQSTGASQPTDWELLGNYDMDSNGRADQVMFGNVLGGAYIGYYKDGDTTSNGWVNIGFLNNADHITWENKIGNLTGNAGKNSIVWHAAELGALGVWTDGTDNWTSLGGGFNADWSLVGTGDFNDDGKDSVLMSFNSGAKYYTVDLNGTITELSNSDSGWAVKAIGDFSGDGKDDIVAFHQETGLVAKWENGSSSQWSLLGQLNAQDWFVVGAGDYSGDGKDDLLVRQFSTGMLGYYTCGDMTQWNELGRGVDMKWTVIA